jgi:hypothetical protein
MYCLASLEIAKAYSEHWRNGNETGDTPRVCTYDYKDMNLVCLMSQAAVDHYIPDYIEYFGKRVTDKKWWAGFHSETTKLMQKKRIHGGNLAVVARDPYFSNFFKERGFDGLMTKEGGELYAGRTPHGKGPGNMTSIVIFNPKAKLVAVRVDPPAIDFSI